MTMIEHQGPEATQIVVLQRGRGQDEAWMVVTLGGRILSASITQGLLALIGQDTPVALVAPGHAGPARAPVVVLNPTVHSDGSTTAGRTDRARGAEVLARLHLGGWRETATAPAAVERIAGIMARASAATA